MDGYAGTLRLVHKTACFVNYYVAGFLKWATINIFHRLALFHGLIIDNLVEYATLHRLIGRNHPRVHLHTGVILDNRWLALAIDGIHFSYGKIPAYRGPLRPRSIPYQTFAPTRLSPPTSDFLKLTVLVAAGGEVGGETLPQLIHRLHQILTARGQIVDYMNPAPTLNALLRIVLATALARSHHKRLHGIPYLFTGCLILSISGARLWLRKWECVG